MKTTISGLFLVLILSACGKPAEEDLTPYFAAWTNEHLAVDLTRGTQTAISFWGKFTYADGLECQSLVSVGSGKLFFVGTTLAVDPGASTQDQSDCTLIGGAGTYWPATITGTTLRLCLSDTTCLDFTKN